MCQESFERELIQRNSPMLQFSNVADVLLGDDSNKNIWAGLRKQLIYFLISTASKLHAAKDTIIHRLNHFLRIPKKLLAARRVVREVNKSVYVDN